MQDTNGQSAQATITVTTDTPAPPKAADDSATEQPGQPVTISVVDNDQPGPSGAALDPTTVKLIDPATGDPATTVTVTGEGTWTVDPDTGKVTFTPEDGFTGSPSPIDYTVQDTNGQSAQATITVTTDTPAPPTATDTSTAPTSLASTGFDVTGVGIAGGVLLLLGAFFCLGAFQSRRRSS